MLSANATITIKDVRAALRRPLPGLQAHLRMSPQPRPGTERSLDPELDCRHAGVLLLLYLYRGELCLVLTRRTELVNSHQGQISLPGGSLEPGETPADAAVREAWEELAVEPGGLEVLGELSRLYIPPSGFCIYPVVAYSAVRPVFVPFPAEVAEVIEVPLAHMLETSTCTEEVWQIRGQSVRVPFYAVGPHKVWGATAMVLCEFLSLLGSDE